mmetsp:Transcript_6050/g.10753  ORF Transcript_6050/g.10753 Transcript_6050/m.10753 type:complete len:91 (+) Transcript_6050:1365-1637(+)
MGGYVVRDYVCGKESTGGVIGNVCRNVFGYWGYVRVFMRVLVVVVAFVILIKMKFRNRNESQLDTRLSNLPEPSFAFFNNSKKSKKFKKV